MFRTKIISKSKSNRADTFDKARILKVIPGINPNCSSGMFAWGYTIFSIPVYLVINIVTTIVRYRKRSRMIEPTVDIISIWKAIRRVRWAIIITAIIGIGVLVFTLQVEMHYGSLRSWIVCGLLISIPPISLITSLVVVEKWLFPRIGKWTLVASPLLYLICVVVIWFLSWPVSYLIWKLFPPY